MGATVLKGITWGHSRGITPLLALSQRYNELHPDIEIRWKKRTLQEFADFPIEELTSEYDLLIIDHPWAGCAAATQTVLPLEKYLPATYLADQAANSVGDSHISYQYGGSQWALAIDAAAPAASYRSDLLVRPPAEWGEVLELAEKGKVAVPAIPIDLLMNFYTFCIAEGERPFLSEEKLVSEEIGIRAIETMRALYSRVDKTMFGYNPIAVAERMSRTDDYWYCPFAYCYSNYARRGYAARLLTYTEMVRYRGALLCSTLGGTGLAVSATSPERETALDFIAFCASPEIQRTFYVQHGGQPGHRRAWNDEEANRLCTGFFRELLPLMDRSYMRPRYNGYLYFQDHAGDSLQACLRDGGEAATALKQMNQFYFQSLEKKYTSAFP